MKKMTIVLMVVLVGLVGCGKSEKDYIGKYVRKLEPSDRRAGIQKGVLEIKPDHTWEFIKRESRSPDFVCGGRWKIIKGKIALHESGAIIAQQTIEAELKGKELIDQHGWNNEVFIKQN